MGAVANLVMQAVSHWMDPKAWMPKLLPGMSDRAGTQLLGKTEFSILKDAGGMFKEYARNVGDILNPLSTPVEKVNAAFRLLETAIFELPAAIADWTEQLLSSKRHLAAFNADIALAAAEGKRREIMRNIASGNRIGPAQLELQRAYDDLMDTLQPIKDSITQMLSLVLTRAAAATSWAVENRGMLANIIGYLGAPGGILGTLINMELIWEKLYPGAIGNGSMTAGGQMMNRIKVWGANPASVRPGEVRRGHAAPGRSPLT